jgi:hypothetical protein
MADIVTGTVTGMVDVSGLVRDSADIRREQALESGDVRRDVVREAFAVANQVHQASDVGQRDSAFNASVAARDASFHGAEAARDASAYYIADVATQNQLAKEMTRSQAWTEAKVDAGFIKVAGDTQLAAAISQGITKLEAARSNGLNGLAHAALGLQIAEQGALTRSLLQANTIADLREKAEERYMKIVELEGDRKHCDRDYDRLNTSIQHSQFQNLQTQLQMMNSDLQTTKQGVVNFGSGTATGGAISSNHA